MQIIIYLQDPKLTLHPSIPLLSIVLCPTEEMGDVRSPRVPLKKENVLQWSTSQLIGEHRAPRITKLQLLGKTQTLQECSRF